MRLMRSITFCLLALLPWRLFAAPSPVALSVWVNEAIVATWTWDYRDYLVQQGQIAHYFTAEGWINYSNALKASGLLEAAQKNRYSVSAVAIAPPTVTMAGNGVWKGEMPLLVVYKNPQYTQKQSLMVTVFLTETSGDAGVRGLAISSMQSAVLKAPCICQPDADSAAPAASEPVATPLQKN